MRSLLSKCLGALPARRNKGVDRKDAERGEGGTRMLRGATPASTCARCTRSTRDEIFYAPLSPSVRPLELHAIQPRCSPPERLDVDHTSIVLHRRSLISLSPFSFSLSDFFPRFRSSSAATSRSRTDIPFWKIIKLQTGINSSNFEDLINRKEETFLHTFVYYYFVRIDLFIIHASFFSFTI